MLQNLHTHTTFCDGRDTPREMVERAIELGFDSLGFSGHAVTSYHINCELCDIPGYIDTVRALGEEFKDRIEIFCGTELDYYSHGIMPELGFDYRIISVHYADIGGHCIEFDTSYEVSKKAIDEDFGGDPLAFARAYYEKLVEMPDKLHGDFVGHFDLLTKFSERHPDLIDTESRAYRDLALSALDALRGKMEFFEVNTGAIGRGYRTAPYPAPFILDRMRELDCKLLISSDCHNRDYLDCHFRETREYLKAHGIDTVYNFTRRGFVGEKI